MFICIFFITFLRVCTSIDDDESYEFLKDYFYRYSFPEELVRVGDSEAAVRHSDFPVTTKPCEHLGRTNKSPYVAIVLFKTSGSFLGMGGIIDRRTVLTSAHALSHTTDNTHNLLIVAGSRSPWWGEGAQVRKVRKAAVNDFELAVLNTEKDFDFNARVGPIPLMRKLYTDWRHIYGSHVVVFGLALDEHMSPGESVTKSSLYYTATQTITTPEDCMGYYLDLNSGFNYSYHVCLYNNGSFCAGNMGSPVVGITKSDGKAELLGVVIRSDCVVLPKPTLAVNLAWLDPWIRANSLLHFKIQPKPIP